MVHSFSNLSATQTLKLWKLTIVNGNALMSIQHWKMFTYELKSPLLESIMKIRNILIRQNSKTFSREWFSPVLHMNHHPSESMLSVEMNVEQISSWNFVWLPPTVPTLLYDCSWLADWFRICKVYGVPHNHFGQFLSNKTQLKLFENWCHIYNWIKLASRLLVLSIHFFHLAEKDENILHQWPSYYLQYLRI